MGPDWYINGRCQFCKSRGYARELVLHKYDCPVQRAREVTRELPPVVVVDDNHAPDMLFVLFVWGFGLLTGAALTWTGFVVWG